MRKFQLLSDGELCFIATGVAALLTSASRRGRKIDFPEVDSLLQELNDEMQLRHIGAWRN